MDGQEQRDGEGRQAPRRDCVEGVAYRVLTGTLRQITRRFAELGCRHERALGDVFSGVLGLCVGSVGVGAIDGTNWRSSFLKGV